MPLMPSQQQFVDRFLGQFAKRTLLVGSPGMGKTATAMRAAHFLLDAGAVDKIITITASYNLAAQWHVIAEQNGRKFASDFSPTAADDGAVTTAAQIQREGISALLSAVGSETRLLVLVDDLEEVSRQLASTVSKLIEPNALSRALFVSRVTPDAKSYQEISFDNEFFIGTALAQPNTQSRIRLLSPSYALLAEVQRDLSRLDDISWRDFEKLIASLLERDGYKVELMKGTKDNNVDVIGVKDLGPAGLFKSLWQAKKNRIDRRIGISLLRELADTRIEHGASKAVIVTTSYLTRGALDRVERDKYVLGKVDRDDFANWVNDKLRQ